MKFQILSAALAIGLAAPAVAQPGETPAATPETETVAVGAKIYGSDGAEIGTVARVEGNTVLLNVDDRAIPIPAAAMAARENGATINITKAELVSQFEQQLAKFEAQLEAAMVQGAEVKTADGQLLGNIESTADDAVVVTVAEGPLTLPRNLLTLDRQGQLIVRATMGQIKQAMSANPEEG